jgi:hypothetical protein
MLVLQDVSVMGNTVAAALTLIKTPKRFAQNVFLELYNSLMVRAERDVIRICASVRQLALDA